jgi:hypothetical protein
MRERAWSLGLSAFQNGVVSALRRTDERPAEAGHYVPNGNGSKGSALRAIRERTND